MCGFFSALVFCFPQRVRTWNWVTASAMNFNTTASEVFVEEVINILFLSCSELKVKWGDNANIQEELKMPYKNLQKKQVRGPLDGRGAGCGELCLTKRRHNRAAGGWRRRNTGWDECKMGKLCLGALPGVRLNESDEIPPKITATYCAPSCAA